MKLRGTVEGADCASCPLSSLGTPDKPVVGIGPEDPIFIVLGEGPGFNEVRQGQPFIGEPGKVLTAALKQLGISRDKVWISNATLCHYKGANDKLRKEAARCCRGRLNKELEQFPNKPVLITGAVCASELLQETKFKITEQKIGRASCRERV